MLICVDQNCKSKTLFHSQHAATDKWTRAKIATVAKGASGAAVLLHSLHTILHAHLAVVPELALFGVCGDN